MTTTKYFADMNGTALPLVDPHGLNNADFAAKFPGIKGRRYDSFRMLVGKSGADTLPVTRIVNFKSNPSRHQCDARCIHAKGRTMNCECSCGGKNHGQGSK